MFNLFKKKIRVTSVKQGQHLDQAVAQSVDDFFAKRMKNRIKKILGYNWEILWRTEEWIYFGYPKGGSREKQYVETLYKVNQAQLKNDFPGFETITGQQVRIAASKAVRDSHPLDHCVTLLQNLQWQAQLQANHIALDIRWVYSADGAPEVSQCFDLTLDHETLSLLAFSDKVCPEPVK